MVALRLDVVIVALAIHINTLPILAIATLCLSLFLKVSSDVFVKHNIFVDIAPLPAETRRIIRSVFVAFYCVLPIQLGYEGWS